MPRRRVLSSLMLMLVLMLAMAGYWRALGRSQPDEPPYPAFLPQVFLQPTQIIPPRVVISEVLYDAFDAPEPASEWIEIANPHWMPIDISNYKVGDAAQQGSTEGMVILPEGTILQPTSVLLIANRASQFETLYGFLPDFELEDSLTEVPELATYTDWGSGDIELTNDGDGLFLLNAGDVVIDAVSWGNSTQAFDPSAVDAPAGSSLERYPAWRDTDSAADWRAQAAPNPGDAHFAFFTPTPWPTIARSPTPFGGLLLISEVLPDPQGVDPQGEWVELYNVSGFPVNLAHIRLGDEETQGGGEAMLRFPDGLSLAPGERLVMAVDGAAFHAAYGFDPQVEVLDSPLTIPVMLRESGWGSGSFNLSSSGDEVLLLDDAGRIVDAVSWGSSTFAFQPALPAATTGASFERFPADQDRNLAADWRVQFSPQPGEIVPSTPTPTASNTAHPLTPSNTPSPPPTDTPEPPTPEPSMTHSPTPTPTPPPYPLFSEVLVSSVWFDQDHVWLEIAWFGDQPFDLGGYCVGDEETNGGSEGMACFPAGATIQPGGTLVIARDAAAAAQANPAVHADYEILPRTANVPDLIPAGDWASGSFALNLFGDELLLLDPARSLVDAISWGSSSFAFSPGLPVPSPGTTFERYPPTWDRDTADDWRIQAAPSPHELPME